MNISFGFMLMLVGMVTVFVILLIVIYGSRLLIRIVNRIAGEEAGPSAKARGNISDSTRRILEAAVSEITGGKGRIIKITEI